MRGAALSVGEVGKRLDGVRERLPRQQLHEVAADFAGAAQALREAAAGSSSTEPEDIAKLWELASGKVVEAIELLTAAEAAIVRYLQSIGATGDGGAVAATPTRSTSTAAKPADASTVTDAKAREIMDKLPKRSDTNKKTSGRWVGADGREQGPLTSGRDEDAAKAVEVLQELGIGPSRGTLLSTEHVEVKFAAQMRGTDATHVSLVINNVPCGGRYSCDRLLPQILNAGQSVTLYWPGGKKLYTGGKS